MSVSNLQSSTGALVGNNSTTTGYVVPFAFQLPSDLVVVKRDASGNVTTLSLASGDYTVTQNANLSGGTVYTTTAWDATNTLVISRVVPLTQLLTLIPGAKEPADAITSAFDKLTYITQQIARSACPDTIGAQGVGPYVLGLSVAGNAPYWVPQTAATVPLASILYTQLYGNIPSSKLSTGAPTWDAAGNLTATSFNGNANTATKLANARTVSLTGDITGSASFDGSSNASIPATIPAGTITASRLGTAEQKQIAKAWVSFRGVNAAGAASINAQFNVASVTRSSPAGIYTITFTTDMTDTAYAVVGMAAWANAWVITMNNATTSPYNPIVKTAHQFQIAVNDVTNTGRDFGDMYLVVFGS